MGCFLGGHTKKTEWFIGYLPAYVNPVYNVIAVVSAKFCLQNTSLLYSELNVRLSYLAVIGMNIKLIIASTKVAPTGSVFQVGIASPNYADQINL